MKNKNWFLAIIIGIILLTIIATIIIIMNNNSNKEVQKLSNKIDNELEYLDKTTLSMINQLNNLKMSENVGIQKTFIEGNAQNATSGGSKQTSNRTNW